MRIAAEDDPGDEGNVDVRLVLVVGAVQEPERPADDGARPDDAEPGAQIPRVADEAGVDGAQRRRRGGGDRSARPRSSCPTRGSACRSRPPSSFASSKPGTVAEATRWPPAKNATLVRVRFEMSAANFASTALSATIAPSGGCVASYSTGRATSRYGLPPRTHVSSRR